MSNSDLTSVLFALLLLVGLAQLLGYVFVWLRQPKVVGEILAGVVLGPALLGRIPAVGHLLTTAQHQGNVLEFVYWLGLLLLMFLAGAETQQLFTRDERREVGWLTIVGTGLPFILGLALAPWIIRPSLAGPNGNRTSLTIIVAVGVAVTSVPVVSKIFADLKILHTRFARLILGVAVLEDIVLWLALAVATAVAGQAAPHPSAMSEHLIATVAYFVLGLTLVPRIVKRINKARFNIVAKQSPVGYFPGRAADVLCHCRTDGREPGVRGISGRFCRRSQEEVHLCRCSGCDWEGGVCVFHPSLLRHRGAQAGPDPGSVGVDDGGVHRGNMPD